MVKSTLVSLLGTPELRLSLGSDSGGVESYKLGSDNLICVLWVTSIVPNHPESYDSGT